MRSRVQRLSAWFVIIFSSFFLAVVMTAGCGYFAYGSVYALPALAQGKVVIAEKSSVKDLILFIGERQQVAFNLINLSSRTVTINGMRANCTCIQAEEIPLNLPPNAKRTFRVWVKPIEDQAGKKYTQSIELYLSATNSCVLLTVDGVVSKHSTTQ